MRNVLRRTWVTRFAATSSTDCGESQRERSGPADCEDHQPPSVSSLAKIYNTNDIELFQTRLIHLKPQVVGHQSWEGMRKSRFAKLKDEVEKVGQHSLKMISRLVTQNRSRPILTVLILVFHIGEDSYELHARDLGCGVDSPSCWKIVRLFGEVFRGESDSRLWWMLGSTYVHGR